MPLGKITHIERIPAEESKLYYNPATLKIP